MNEAEARSAIGEIATAISGQQAAACAPVCFRMIDLDPGAGTRKKAMRFAAGVAAGGVGLAGEALAGSAFSPDEREPWTLEGEFGVIAVTEDSIRVVHLNCPFPGPDFHAIEAHVEALRRAVADGSAEEISIPISEAMAWADIRQSGTLYLRHGDGDLDLHFPKLTLESSQSLDFGSAATFKSTLGDFGSLCNPLEMTAALDEGTSPMTDEQFTLMVGDEIGELLRNDDDTLGRKLADHKAFMLLFTALLRRGGEERIRRDLDLMPPLMRTAVSASLVRMASEATSQAKLLAKWVVGLLAGAGLWWIGLAEHIDIVTIAGAAICLICPIGIFLAASDLLDHRWCRQMTDSLGLR